MTEQEKERRERILANAQKRIEEIDAQIPAAVLSLKNRYENVRAAFGWNGTFQPRCAPWHYAGYTQCERCVGASKYIADLEAMFKLLDSKAFLEQVVKGKV